MLCLVEQELDEGVSLLVLATRWLARSIARYFIDRETKSYGFMLLRFFIHFCFVCLGLSLTSLNDCSYAQESLDASWRSGVSRWTGTGYVEITPSHSSAIDTIGEVNTADVDAAASGDAAPSDLRFARGSFSSTSTPYLDLKTAAISDPSAPPSFVSAEAAPDISLPPVSSPDDSVTEDFVTGDSVIKDSTEVLSSNANVIDEMMELETLEADLGWRAQFGRVWGAWFSRREWMDAWDTEAELGIDGSSGNASTLGVRTGFESKRSTKYFDVELDVDYRQKRNRNATTEDNGRVATDVDRMFNGTPHSAFGKFGIEWDRFKAFDLRVNLNGGYGYHWIRTDDASLVTRFGAGASREIGAPVDQWIPEAVFGVESERTWASGQKIKQKLEYFPAWEDFGDFRLVANLSWEAALDEADKFRLKSSMNNRYDSTPQGARRNDLYYSLLLLYKF